MSTKTSATGGFLHPNPQPPPIDSIPAGLTFVQFIQQLLVGLSMFQGALVRPEWQQEPPKQPDIDTNWLAFGFTQATADFNAYVSKDPADVTTLQRNEEIPISISVYGPQAYDNMGLIRDGFQLTQNLATLRRAKIGFAYDNPAIHVPDFFNERWYDRWRFEVVVRRQIQRVYPILSFVSATGVIYTQVATENIQLPWAVEGP